MPNNTKFAISLCMVFTEKRRKTPLPGVRKSRRAQKGARGAFHPPIIGYFCKFNKGFFGKPQEKCGFSALFYGCGANFPVFSFFFV